MRHVFDPKKGRRGVMSTTPAVRSTVPLTVLENGCNGIGDALCYAWVLASIRAAGRPISMRSHRWPEVFATFGQADITGSAKAARIGHHPPKGISSERPWVRHWLDCFGYSDVPIVRPAYTPNPSDTEWARAFWDGRGQGRRILLFPESAHACREWPRGHFAHLAWSLHREGYSVLVCGTRDLSGGNPFPYALWGLPFGKWCALVAQSHLVIGNDSGPAHVAGTLNIPTLALTGPSPTAQFFAHLPSLTPMSVTLDRVPCVGCNWDHMGGKGYRAACDSQCLALATLSPFEVEQAALALLGPSITSEKKFGLVPSLQATGYGPSYYEEHKAAGLDYLGHGDWQQNYAKWLASSIPMGGDALDLGCACGSIVKGFRAHGVRMVGVDCSEDMIGRGRQAWPDLKDFLFVGDGANLHRWGDGHFGFIHCAQVAEHWRPASVPAICAEMARVLAPDGLLFLCLDTQELYDRQHRDPAKEDPTHFCIKPLSWWEGTLSDVGLVRDLEMEDRVQGAPGSYTKRYDWDWMVLRKRAP